MKPAAWLEREILVTVGTGGVGKTTLAAAFGLEAARAGRRALVITIDPARRLADALGLVPGGEARDLDELGQVRHRRNDTSSSELLPRRLEPC